MKFLTHTDTGTFGAVSPTWENGGRNAVFRLTFMRDTGLPKFHCQAVSWLETQMPPMYFEQVCKLFTPKKRYLHHKQNYALLFLGAYMICSRPVS